MVVRKNKKGQAMIETIFMLPFIIVLFFFIYQSYTLINKVQVVQKYLKGGAIGILMNRNIITAENPGIQKKLPVQLPPDGRYFAVFNDNQRKQMKVSLDDITINMLLYFCPSDEKNTIRNFLKGQTATEALGFCIGGATVMGDQVSTNVLQMADGDTCSKK